MSGDHTADRLEKNWDDLLQELRVSQTGVQILTGFLLTLPFTTRFVELDDFQRNTYLLVLAGSVLTTAILVAPVAYHRFLFRRKRREWMVAAGHQTARAGLLMLALTTSGVVFMVFDVVLDRGHAVLAGSIATVFFVALWVVVPWFGRESGAPETDDGSRRG